MTCDPERHRRRSLRAKWQDYSAAGCYFVTICSYERECIFGEIVDGAASLSEPGRIVEFHWRETPSIRRYVTIDAFVVMPNHLHGIITITPLEAIAENRSSDTAARGTAPGSLGAIIQQIKGVTTRHINVLRGVTGVPVWQRNYHEHVIRDADDLDRIRAYITANPFRWRDDEHHPDNLPATNPISPM
jgi:putative transposase